MFEAFYNLSDNPFRLTPDPKFCFRHHGHDQAYAYLQYALRLGEGFIMVTGRPGIGKTMLAQVFLAELELSEVVAARVASVNVEATDLMRVVAYSYGIDVEGMDKATILVRLKQFFVDQTQSGKRVLLIIDEAQGLPYSALEELRLLADLQMDSRPLLQLFLVGQEKLRDLMQEPAMEQFQQRVIGACHLEPLSLADTRAYMEHRLRKADWKGDPELTGEALLAIYRFSKGVPRHINKISTRLLLDGFMQKKHELNRDDVLGVAEALRAERLAPLGAGQADATDNEDAGSVPELENGTLTLADLALRAEPEQPPLVARPVPPGAAATVDESTDTRHTKQTTANPRWAGPGVAKAGSWMVSGRSGNSGLSYRQRSRPLSAAGRPQRVQRRRSQRARIPAWKSDSVLQLYPWKRFLANTIWWMKERITEGSRQLDIAGLGVRLGHYKDKIEPVFESHPWIAARRGMWVGALAAAALSLTLLLNFADEDVDRHSVMFEKSPETAGPMVAAEEDPLQIARMDDHREIESASLESFGYQAVNSRVDVRSDDGRLVNSNELSSHAGNQPGLPVQSPALTIPEFERDSVVPDDTQVSYNYEDTVSGVVEEFRDGQPEPAPSATAPNVAVVMLQSIVDTAEAIESIEPSDEHKGAAVAEQSVVVTDSAVDVAVVDKNSVPGPVTREDRIIELLSLAQRALRNDRLLIPSNDNAYRYYQQVLALEPGNNAALFGMDQIVERYAVLGRKALDRQDKDKAEKYIARGSRVLPGDSRLIALQESMSAPGEAEIQLEAQQVAGSKPQGKGPLSWFKAIFGKGRSADPGNDAPVEDYSY